MEMEWKKRGPNGWQMIGICINNTNNENKWMMKGWNEWDVTKQRKMRGCRVKNDHSGMKRNEEQSDGCNEEL